MRRNAPLKPKVVNRTVADSRHTRKALRNKRKKEILPISATTHDITPSANITVDNTSNRNKKVISMDIDNNNNNTPSPDEANITVDNTSNTNNNNTPSPDNNNESDAEYIPTHIGVVTHTTTSMIHQIKQRKRSKTRERDSVSLDFLDMDDVEYMKDTEEEYTKQYTCLRCNRHFRTIQQVQKHDKTHQGQGFSLKTCCENCGQVFIVWGEFYTHQCRGKYVYPADNQHPQKKKDENYKQKSVLYPHVGYLIFDHTDPARKNT